VVVTYTSVSLLWCVTCWCWTVDKVGTDSHYNWVFTYNHFLLGGKAVWCSPNRHQCSKSI